MSFLTETEVGGMFTPELGMSLKTLFQKTVMQGEIDVVCQWDFQARRSVEKLLF